MPLNLLFQFRGADAGDLAGTPVRVAWVLRTPTGEKRTISHEQPISVEGGRPFVGDKIDLSDVSSEAEGVWVAKVSVNDSPVAAFLFALEVVDPLPEASVRTMLEERLRTTPPTVTIYGGNIRPEVSWGFTPDPMWREYLGILREFGVTWRAETTFREVVWFTVWEVPTLAGVEHPPAWRRFERQRSGPDRHGRWQVVYAAAQSLQLEILSVSVTRTRGQVRYRLQWTGCPPICDLYRRIESLHRRYPGRVLPVLFGRWEGTAALEQWSGERVAAFEWSRGDGWRKTRR
jgi:hypothetical protein